MQYLGGKARLAEQLADVMLAPLNSRARYVEPFVGGGSVFTVMAPHFIRATAGDVHEDLVLMYRALLDGWEPPDTVTEAEYQALRKAEPSALRAFVGFGCSFGAKWFGGYARDPRRKGGDASFAATGRRLLLARADVWRTLPAVSFHHRAYDAWDIGPGDVVYCDPPYAGTTGYKGTPTFDHDQFWDTCRKWHDAGAVVFVSEFTAPDDWRPVWSIERSIAVDGQRGKAHTRVDRLYMHSSV